MKRRQFYGKLYESVGMNATLFELGVFSNIIVDGDRRTVWVPVRELETVSREG